MESSNHGPHQIQSVTSQLILLCPAITLLAFCGSQGKSSFAFAQNLFGNNQIVYIKIYI